MEKTISDYAEASLVAKTLDDPKCFTEANLKPEHFFNPRYKALWSCFQTLVSTDQDIDVLSVAQELDRRKKLDALGGEPGLTKILLEYNTAAPVRFHAEVIREAWMERQIRLLGGRIELLQESGISSEDILDELDRRLSNLKASVTRQLPNMKEIINSEQEQIHKDIEKIKAGEKLFFGLPTGLALDAIVPGGLPRGKIVALFGESGNFKTTTKNNIVWGIAQSGVGKVLDLSFEDDDLLTSQRCISRHTGVGYGKIATRQLDEKQLNCINSLSSEAKRVAANVIMGSEVDVDVDEIIRTARYYRQYDNLVAVVIDYVQLISDDREKLNDTIRKLQLAAKRDNLCYILVSQVKQDVDFRAAQGQNARPRITDMLGSSAFRMAPKLSIGVYRPFKYHVSPQGNPPGGAPDYRRLVNEHPEGEEIYKQILELWLNKNIYGEQEVCIPVMVNLETGLIVDVPKHIKDLLL